MPPTNPPTWQETAENLRDTVRRLTDERDELRRRLAVARAGLSLIAVAIVDDDDPDKGGQQK